MNVLSVSVICHCVLSFYFEMAFLLYHWVCFHTSAGRRGSRGFTGGESCKNFFKHVIVIDGLKQGTLFVLLLSSCVKRLLYW